LAFAAPPAVLAFRRRDRHFNAEATRGRTRAAMAMVESPCRLRWSGWYPKSADRDVASCFHLLAKAEGDGGTSNVGGGLPLRAALGRYGLPPSLSLDDAPSDSSAEGEKALELSSCWPQSPSVARHSCSDIKLLSVGQLGSTMQAKTKDSITNTISTSGIASIDLYRRLLTDLETRNAKFEGIAGKEDEGDVPAQSLRPTAMKDLLMPDRHEVGVCAQYSPCFEYPHVAADSLPPGVTSLIVRNISRRGRNVRNTLLSLWKAEGCYNLLYVPYSTIQRRWAHYAFVNCVSHEAATAFKERWQGFRMDPHMRAKGFQITASKVQGLEDNLRYLAEHDADRITGDAMPVVFEGSRRIDFRSVIAAFC